VKRHTIYANNAFFERYLEVGGSVGKCGKGVFIGFGVVHLWRAMPAQGLFGANHLPGYTRNKHKGNGESKRKNAEEIGVEGRSSKEQHSNILL
jgi:hypothetical protein